MANAKISNDTVFVPETNISNIDGLAGFAGTGNVKITGTALVASLETTLNLDNFNTGTLSVGRGGTGANTFTANGILIGNTASAISATAELADGQLLIGYTGNAPVAATLTQGTDLSITNGNGSINIGHANVANTPASNSTTLSAGGNFTAINSVTVSAQGHLTAQNTETYTLPSESDTTYSISAVDGDNADEEKIVLTAGGSGSGSTTVVLEASTGLTVAKSTGKITFTNSSPDQTVALTSGTGISTSGTYPNFTITNSAPDQTVALTGGTGISTSGTYPNFTITNSSPNQATPAAGSSSQLQYNDGSNGFAASANLTFATDILTVKDNVVIRGDGSTNAGKLRLECYDNSNTHYVDLIGPDHGGGASSYSIKFPAAGPAASNKILESNSSGDLSWIDTPTDTSIYAANGSLTGARTVTMGAHSLTFASTSAGQEVEFQKNLKVSGQSFNPLQTISSTSSWTPDWDSGNVQTMELTANTAIANPSNIELGATYIIILKQDSTGSRTVTWGTQYKFPANTPPILTTGANKADVITLVAYSSTVLMCTSVLDFATS